MKTFLFTFLHLQLATAAGPLSNSTEPFLYFADRDQTELNSTIPCFSVSHWSPFTLQSANQSIRINESSNSIDPSPPNHQHQDDEPIPAVAIHVDNNNVDQHGIYAIDNDIPAFARSELLCIGTLICLLGSILIVVGNILLMLHFNN